ncbi:MAG: type II toxin-antitoxin system PemK/MazF family toxin [Chloroflexi bacterium]|nr:type II toxin-antitoxin system PemK/MazF family toxin [Chloroflexota bacterium]
MSEGEETERGDLFRVAPLGSGHEVAGPHYAVVVSDTPYNRLSTAVVVPFSSRVPAASFRPETVIKGRQTRALVEQVGAIDRRLLRERLGNLAGSAIMAAIDEQLKYFLGLDH